MSRAAVGAPHVLVVGSGVAGLTAALDLVGLRADVTVVTKTALGEGSTAWAQGGLAAVVPGGSDGTGSDDAVDLHVADTLDAGAGLCREDVVRVVCEGGAAAVATLAERGVAFDRASDRPGAGYARGLEAAHSRHRVLHAGGDVTGARIADALVAATRALARAGRLELLEHTALADLVLDGGRVVGADLLAGDGTPQRRPADAVVLATGGAGQLYAHTTNPAVATADGVAAAWRAGALLADLEMVQFHPTAAHVAGGAAFLVSEAVRGEGAVLLDERGHRFLADGPLADPRAELAPRDVVARALAAVMAEQDGRPALLDAARVAARLGGRLDGRFPGIDALCRAAGLDWSHHPVPVTPAAHYWMGGVVTDSVGRTSLPGLWAVGEVASTGVHGANRLASNSLLEAAVVAGRAATDVVRALAAGVAGGALAGGALAGGALAGGAMARGALAGGALAGGAPQLAAEGDGDLLELSGTAPRLPREQLQALMWEHVGLLREEAGLAVAAKSLDPPAPSAHDRTGRDRASATGTVPPRALPPGTGAPAERRATAVRRLEDANLATAARLVVAAARHRTESRGAHFRSDHPRRAPLARRTLLRRAP